MPSDLALNHHNGLNIEIDLPPPEKAARQIPGQIARERWETCKNLLSTCKRSNIALLVTSLAWYGPYLYQELRYTTEILQPSAFLVMSRLVSNFIFHREIAGTRNLIETFSKSQDFLRKNNLDVNDTSIAPESSLLIPFTTAIIVYLIAKNGHDSNEVAVALKALVAVCFEVSSVAIRNSQRERIETALHTWLRTYNQEPLNLSK